MISSFLGNLLIHIGFIWSSFLPPVPGNSFSARIRCSTNSAPVTQMEGMSFCLFQAIVMTFFIELTLYLSLTTSIETFCAIVLQKHNWSSKKRKYFQYLMILIPLLFPIVRIATQASLQNLGGNPGSPFCNYVSSPSSHPYFDYFWLGVVAVISLITSMLTFFSFAALRRFETKSLSRRKELYYDFYRRSGFAIVVYTISLFIFVFVGSLSYYNLATWSSSISTWISCTLMSGDCKQPETLPLWAWRMTDILMYVSGFFTYLAYSFSSVREFELWKHGVYRFYLFCLCKLPSSNRVSRLESGSISRTLDLNKPQEKSYSSLDLLHHNTSSPSSSHFFFECRLCLDIPLDELIPYLKRAHKSSLTHPHSRNTNPGGSAIRVSKRASVTDQNNSLNTKNKNRNSENPNNSVSLNDSEVNLLKPSISVSSDISSSCSAHTENLLSVHVPSVPPALPSGSKKRSSMLKKSVVGSNKVFPVSSSCSLDTANVQSLEFVPIDPHQHDRLLPCRSHIFDKNNGESTISRSNSLNVLVLPSHDSSSEVRNIPVDSEPLFSSSHSISSSALLPIVQDRSNKTI